VRSLLTRLVRKTALGYEPQGRNYVYEPRVSEADCVFAASESFLDQVFGGSLTPLVAYFVERRKLTRKQINELKELLDQEGRP
jgi:BlaI family penicillinase repressor